MVVMSIPAKSFYYL